MVKTKRQVCIIHGGVVFDSDDDARHYLKIAEINYERLLYASSWKSWLSEQLGEYDVLAPEMPSKFNAKYDEWQLYFARILPFLRPEAVLVGHSLGGIFLAKYFQTHPPSKPFKMLVLIAAPYNDDTTESLHAFKLQNAIGLKNAAHEIHLFHSKDDPIVPFEECLKYKQDITSAHLHTFEDKQHFNEVTFPELISIIS